MSEYIIWESDKTETTDYLGVKHGVIHFEKREEIVRCRDCVHYKPYRTNHHGLMNRCEDEHGHSHRRDEDDFCSKGERRES